MSVNSISLHGKVISFFLCFPLFWVLPAVSAEPLSAQYADIPYDVVYVRCPRAKEGVKWWDETLSNWNGVNDVWLSATNNIYQQPGCDLVLHHSSPEYGGGLPQGDPLREEVLVNCDENDNLRPVCTIADPNVSMDGKVIVYTKFLDTRNFVTDVGVITGNKYGHSQAFVRLYPDGSGPNQYSGKWAKRVEQPVPVFDTAALIFQYDLSTGQETQVSPDSEFARGRAVPGKDPEWQANVPITDNGAVFVDENTLAFTSNRDGVLQKFKLFKMNLDGSNLELIGHRTMTLQLHPFVLKDGRIAYTNFDAMIQKVANNQFSLFSVRPDGGDPFILAGKHDPSGTSLHFATQLSDGDVISAMYYSKNNRGFGSLLRFPIDPEGPDFEHKGPSGGWIPGSELEPFVRVGQFDLTPFAQRSDFAAGKYEDANDYWLHPSRSVQGKPLVIGGQELFVNKSLITMSGKFSHPAAAPDNNLIATYAIGATTTMNGAYSYETLEEVIERIGKDAGVWLLPLQANDTKALEHIARDGLIIVDFPEYQEIMPRALVSYEDIYGIKKPGLLADGVKTKHVEQIDNLGLSDARLSIGEPYGLTGAATLFDRETRSLNGVPWSMKDGGGTMSGRTYTNLATSGADLAIYDNSEIAGIRVLLVEPLYPINNWGGLEQWAGFQQHHLRILGEYPVRKKSNGLVVLDESGNPDTSFVIKLPADTPFLFQTIDINGMALDIETTTRSVHRGEQQFCGGCHVHTRESLDPFSSVAKLDTSILADFTQASAPLFDSVSTDGMPAVKFASEIYSESISPGVSKRRSFEIDWNNGISQIINNRCSSCHGEGETAQQITGLRLDGDVRTYDLLKKNGYTREDGVKIGVGTKPGDGLEDVVNNTPGTDRITQRGQCCMSSRWISFNSARSSMLVWALYGERLDGRNPETGLPWGAKGEIVPDDKQGLTGVLVDSIGSEHPEVWPKVGEHLSYVAEMPESEKRLISRWIDLGVPKIIIHEDNLRPVLTITPLVEGGSISKVYVGVWDDSPIDYARFSVTRNGVEFMNGSDVEGKPDVIEVVLPVSINASNGGDEEYVFEIWDKPYKRLEPLEYANEANRNRRTVNGLGLLKMAGESSNHSPTHAVANVTAETGVKTYFYATVTDPDRSDSHLYSIVSQPEHGAAAIENNKLTYLSNEGYLGGDEFRFRATDLNGLSVEGGAVIDVVPKKLITTEESEAINYAPTSASVIVETIINTSVLLAPVVVDANVNDMHTFMLLSDPENGEVVLINNVFEYTPDNSYSGGDSFTFSATDQDGLSVSGIAKILVSKPIHPENAPTQAFANVSTPVNRPVTFSPTIKDPDIDDVHIIEIVNQPRYGAVKISDNKFVYSPDSEFIGSDFFVFRVTDRSGFSVNGYANISVHSQGGGNSEVFSASAAFVTVTNQPLSVIPVIEAQKGNLPFTLTIISLPKHGEATVASNRLLYVPNLDYVGTDLFIFEVKYSTGYAFLGVAKIEVKKGVESTDNSNKPPTMASAELKVSPGQKSIMTPFVMDPDGDEVFTYRIFENPVHGVAYIEENQIAYIADDVYLGKDKFTFIVEDSAGGKVIGIADVTVEKNAKDTSTSFSASLSCYIFLCFGLLAMVKRLNKKTNRIYVK